jgi:GT2 family glycosyltransferase/predicted O-methyltransferase YrrM
MTETNFINLAKNMSAALEVEKKKCITVKDFVELAYSFHFEGHNIAPIQVRDEIRSVLEVLTNMKPRNLLEIGTANGGTLFLLCNMASPDATVISIDMPGGKFGGDLYQNWKTPIYESFRKDRQRIHLLRDDSHKSNTFNEIKKILDSEKLDFLLIDGDHTYDGVRRDFEMYSHLIKNGGIICFHDIKKGPPKMVGGVPRFWAEIKSRYLNVEIVADRTTEGYGIGILFFDSNKEKTVSAEIFGTTNDLKDKQIETLRERISTTNQRLKNTPLGLLSFIYDERLDLQSAFPEVTRGEFARLMRWAYYVCTDQIQDEIKTKETLLPFLEQYIALTKFDSLEEEYEVLKKNFKSSQDTFQKLDASIKEKDEKMIQTLGMLSSAEQTIKEKDNLIGNLRQEIQTIKTSFVFSNVRKILDWLDRNFPRGTRRGEFLRLVAISAFVLRKEGPRSFLHHLNNRVKSQGINSILTSPDEPFRKVVQENNQNERLAQEFMSWLVEKKFVTKKVSKRGKVDIIIPIYNSPDYVIKCVQSVLRYSDNCQLVLVDDASTDPRIGEFLRNLPEKSAGDTEIKVIRNQKNQGFVKTVNLGSRYIRGHFVILNSDTEVSQGWLDRLFLPIIENEESIASVTPLTNSGEICSFPNFVQDNPLFKDLDAQTIDSFFRRYGIPKTIEAPTSVGFCMAVNKTVFEEIGLFDDRTFGLGYGEENDWSMRAFKTGYKNVIVTDLFVYHKHGTSFSSETKKRLMEENLKKIQKLYPQYQSLVGDFIRDDPVKLIRDIMSLVIDNFTSKKKTVLIIDHGLGGGSNIFSRRISEQLSLSFNIIHLSYQPYEKRLEMKYSGFVNLQVSLRSDDIESMLKKIMDFFRIEYILVNDIVSWDYLRVLQAISDSKKRYTVYVHEYFYVCPSWNLIDYQGNFCNIPEFGICKTCLQKNSSRFSDYKAIYGSKEFDIEAWRAESRNFLSNATQVICFSNSAKMLLSKAYPGLKNMMVIEHEVTTHGENYSVRKGDKKWLTVGIPGAIGYHKGAEIIRKLLVNLEFKKIPVRIVIIGTTNEILSHEKTDERFVIHGTFKDGELASLLKTYEVDLVFIPSICPETFSFTTSEAMLLGYPVMCFNIGAPAERVKRFGAGIVLKKTSPAYIIDALKQVLANPSILEEFSKNSKKYSSASFDNQVQVLARVINQLDNKAKITNKSLPDSV